jgi:hypothetical protein
MNMSSQPTTAALDHAIRMHASAHPSEQSYLLDALEEAARLIADLQARVAALEAQESDMPEFDLLEQDSAGIDADWDDEDD